MSVDYDLMAQNLRAEIVAYARERKDQSLTREESHCLALIDERTHLMRRWRWISAPENLQRVGCYPANYPEKPFAFYHPYQEFIHFETLDELVDYALQQETVISESRGT